MAKPGSTERVLTVDEELETSVFVLENQMTQFKLFDARVNLYAIELVEQFRSHNRTYDESTEFVEATANLPEVVALFRQYVLQKSAVLTKIKTNCQKIIEDLA